MHGYTKVAVTRDRKYEVYSHDTSEDIAVLCPVTGLVVKGTPEFPRFVFDEEGDEMTDLETGKVLRLTWVTRFDLIDETTDMTPVRHDRVGTRLLSLLNDAAPYWMSKGHLGRALDLSPNDTNDALADAVELAGDSLESRCIFPGMTDYRLVTTFH